jgi:hypothetical protein
MATELEKAKAAYTKGSARVKTALENIFGKAAFVPKITDRVKTFDDACKVIGLKPDDYGTLHTPKQITQYQKHLYAHLKLMIIAEALNEGWKPNWDDSSEWKYYPYFDMRSKGAGFGFSFANYGRTSTTTCVGSRLCFKNEELAAYAGKQFVELYKDLLIA